MNTTRPRAGGPATNFAPENRAGKALADATPNVADASPVTVGRSGGVVPPSSDALIYEVDASSHRVVARYANGGIAFAFGGFGRGRGQFDTPLHVATVSPEFFGEPQGAAAVASVLTPWLAVADYGNCRIQYFECDGAYIGETDLESGQPPCHLTWRAPALEVTTLDGRAVRVHVAAALLSSTGRDRRHQPAVQSDPRRTWRVC